MYKIILLIIISCLLPLPTGVFALSQATELQSLLYKNSSLQASFTQTLPTKSATSNQEPTQGKMYIKRPGKFRWEIILPDIQRQLIIINGKQMLLYDPGLAQLVKNTIDYRKPGNPALLLSSPSQDLNKLFTITKCQNTSTTSRALCFKLQPQNPTKSELEYQWLKLYFLDKILVTMQIADNLEQISTINFSHILTNIKIAPQQFIFTPPPQTEIIGAS